MAARTVNAERYFRIVGRQFPMKWDSGYVPSILATPREAPGCSSASTIPSALMGRDINVLSRNEKRVLLFALYHPSTWYIREQQMLYWDDHPHFLHGHHLAGSREFPRLRGTFRIAQDLGVIKLHPLVLVPSAKHGKRVRVPFPLVGDLLVFLTDENGPFAVNLSVKDKLSDFTRPFSLLGARTLEEMKERAVMRHTLERLHYEAGRIRTEQVAGSMIPQRLGDNMRFLWGEIHTSPTWSVEQMNIGAEIARDALPKELSPVRIGLKIERELGLPIGAGMKMVFGCIWRRTVRADLFAALVPDKPLRAEQRDVLQVYASWFHR